MFKLPLRQWIGNAAAVLFGSHGDVTTAAQEAGCSRQTVYDHAHKVQQALHDAQDSGPSRQQLLDQIDQLREENRQLWDCLDQSIDFPKDKQQHFVTTASAMGLSLNQILTLLAILLPPALLPSRATLGRLVNHSARRAGAILKVFDKAARPLILSLCLDEIFFHHNPVLMGVDPHSMAWVLGQRAKDRTGDTWAKALKDWPDLQDVAADGGSGLERGLHLAAQQRQQAVEQPDAAPAKPIHVRLEVFHIRRDGTRALRKAWARAEAAWEEAEKIDRAKKRFDRQGTDQREFNKTKGEKAWAKAVALFEEV